MQDAIKARVASDAVGCSPQQKLQDYLKAPLEDIADIVGWWGVSIDNAFSIHISPLIFFFLNNTPFNIQ